MPNTLEIERMIWMALVLVLVSGGAYNFLRQRYTKRIEELEAQVLKLTGDQAKLVSLVGTQSQIITDLIEIISRSNITANAELHQLMARVVDNMGTASTVTVQGDAQIGGDLVGRDKKGTAPA